MLYQEKSGNPGYYWFLLSEAQPQSAILTPLTPKNRKQLQASELVL
jgi:hypothetical protein